MEHDIEQGHYYHLVWGVEPTGLKTQLEKISIDLRDVSTTGKMQFSQLKCLMTGTPSLATGGEWGVIVNWDGAPGTYYYNKGGSAYESDSQLDMFKFNSSSLDYTDHTTVRTIENRSGYLNFWLTYNTYTPIILSTIADANWEFHLAFYIN